MRRLSVDGWAGKRLPQDKAKQQEVACLFASEHEAPWPGQSVVAGEHQGLSVDCGASWGNSPRHARNVCYRTDRQKSPS